MTLHHLFPALKKRFNCDVFLKRIARKLYLGFAGDRENGSMPYVEVHCVGYGDDDDTWDEDIETRAVTFNIHSGSILTEKCLEMVEHMMRVFDDADFEGEEITAVTSKRDPGGSGPDVEDGSYSASLDYTFSYQRSNKWPLTRWAVNG